MTHPKFIGITIGPIYRTFAKADKTREIWGASYLFSYLCKKLIGEIISQGIAEKSIMLPHPKEIKSSKPGVGLYPDRIIIEGLDGDFDKIKAAVAKVKMDLADELLLSIKSYSASDPYAKLLKKAISGRKNQALEFLSDYLQVYCVEASPDAIALERDKGKLGTVVSMNVLLDHLELRTSVSGFDPDPIKVFLRGINHSFLLKDAFGKEFKHFPSLPEIGTTELRFISEATRRQYDSIIETDYQLLVNEERFKVDNERKKLEAETDDDVVQTTVQNSDGTDNYVEEAESDVRESELIEKLFNIEGIKDLKRTYHKYVAVVHADGDRMGKLIGSLNDSEVSEFSEDLLEFAKEANKVLAGTRFTNNHETDWGYGAAPIYIGGDDVVFFAPVASRDMNGNYLTVFHLIQQLDEAFDKIFNTKDADGNYAKYRDIGEKDRPCMSYGVSITYIKHPLREAFFQSYDLMSGVKNDYYKTRNRLNFKVQKHSGQWYGGIIDKNDKQSFTAFVNLLDENNRTAPKKEETEQFINSLSQKLRFYQSAIVARALNDTPSELRVGMAALFDNSFDEGVHDRVRPYLNQIRDLLVGMIINAKSGTVKTDEERISEAIDTLHGMLRFIHFIRDNEFRN